MPITTITATGTFSVPAGVTNLTKVECWAGGGGGGNPIGATGGGGGGGGSYVLKNNLTVTPSTSETVTVGAAVAAETEGNVTHFRDITTVFAPAGTRGVDNAKGVGGNAVVGGVGDTKRNGGDGGAVGNLGMDTGGGGGGESAGPSANGNAGADSSGADGGAGGTGTTGGGDGGVGGTFGGASAAAGSIPGGGGGGGKMLGSGGGGARGQIVVTYSHPVSSVTGPSAGNKVTDDTIDLTVNYPAAITVTGSPQIALTIGSNTRQAVYNSGSGTSALVFRYTVVAGDLDTNGISAASPIDLNGGTMNDADAIAALLTFTAPDLSGTTVNVPLTKGAMGAPGGGNRRVGGAILRRRIGRHL